MMHTFLTLASKKYLLILKGYCNKFHNKLLPIVNQLGYTDRGKRHRIAVQMSQQSLNTPGKKGFCNHHNSPLLCLENYFFLGIKKPQLIIRITYNLALAQIVSLAFASYIVSISLYRKLEKQESIQTHF